MMRVAGIDLGTNSFLCLIAEAKPTGEIEVLSDDIRITRLGEGVHKEKRFAAGAIQRADEALRDFSGQIKKFGAKKVLAVATSASRDVENAAELYQLGNKYGIPIKVITGKEEARLTFFGGTLGLKDTTDVAVVDVGGGSTEIIVNKSKHGLISESFNVGCVRLTEMFVKNDPVSSEELRSIEKYSREKMGAAQSHGVKRVIAVAGTPTTFAAVLQGQKFDAKKVEGFEISKKTIEEWISRVSTMRVDEIRKLPGMSAKRADVFLAGLILLKLSLEALEANKLEVSTKGLRYGVIQELSN